MKCQKFEMVLSKEIARQRAKEELGKAVAHLEEAFDILENRRLTRESASVLELISRAKKIARRLS